MLKLLIRADKRMVSILRGEATHRLTMVTDGDLDVAIMSGRGQRRTHSGIRMTDTSADCSSLWRAATCCRAASTSPPTSPTHAGPGIAGWMSTPSEGWVMLNTCEI